MEKPNKTSLILITARTVGANLLVATIVGATNRAYAAENCDRMCDCEEDESVVVEDITAEFHYLEDGKYEPVVLELDSCTSGLEVKVQLASALNDGGIMPTDIFLIYEDEVCTCCDECDECTDCTAWIQIYDDDLIGEHITDGATVYFVISPICDGEIYGDDGYRFECCGYDQSSGEFFYSVRP